MGLVEKIKEVTPFKRYFNFTDKKTNETTETAETDKRIEAINRIYERINQKPPHFVEQNRILYYEERDRLKRWSELTKADAKGRELIFEALEKIKNARSDNYFSIHNSPQINDEIYRKERQLVRELMTTLRNEFKNDPYIPEREMALDIMEIEVNELIDLADKIRRNVKDYSGRREEVRETPEQNFSRNDWEKLKYLNGKYFGTNDQDLKNIEEVILGKPGNDYQIEGAISYFQEKIWEYRIRERNFATEHRSGLSFEQIWDHYYRRVSSALALIEKESNCRLDVMNKDLLQVKRPETKELIATEIEKFKKIKDDHRHMIYYWAVVQYAVLTKKFGGSQSASPVIEAKVKAVYPSLSSLGTEYNKYAYTGEDGFVHRGGGLEILKKTRAYLEIPQERTLRERLDEAKSGRSGEAAKGNECFEAERQSGKENSVGKEARVEERGLL